MKVMKAMKKLKFWPRIKKKKKHPFPFPSSPPPPSRPPPPPPYNHHHHHSHYEPLLPSAPPLPPWLEYHLQFQEETALLSPPSSAAEITDNNTTTISKSSQLFAGCQEYPVEADSSYQQQLVQNPVNDEVGVATLERSRGGRLWFVVRLGAHLVRCAFPCFRVREASEEDSRRDLLF